MSWIKKTMGRLFGSPSDEEWEETTNLEPEKEQPQETNSPKRPAFRFPMITDAEIYGWDEDPDETLHVKKQAPFEMEEEGQTENIPLYKNDRWPAEPPSGEIHRAGNKKKYEQPASTERTFVPQTDKRPEWKEEIVKQRNHTPFKPTEVPSPVYGFSQPKHRKAVRDQTSNLNDGLSTKDGHSTTRYLSKEVLPSGIKFIPKIEESIETDTLPIPSSMQPVDEPREELQTTVQERESEKDSEVEDISLMATARQSASEQKEIEDTATERISESTQIALLDREPIEEIITQEEETQEEIQEEEMDEVAHEVLPNEILPMETVMEESVPPINEETDAPSDLVEDKPERIVPFNVVMLKSDKEKQNLRALADSRSSSSSQMTTAVSNGGVTQKDMQTLPIEEKPALQEERKELKQPIDVVQPASPTNSLVVHEEEQYEQEPLPHYVYPSIEDLVPAEEQQEDTEWLTSQSEKLVEALSHFSVQADILEAVQGPTVTRFELTVGFGTKVSKVRNLTDDLKLALAAEDIRIQAPIPGTSSIGIEIPNRTTRPVRISEVIDTEKFTKSDSPLEAVLGLSLTGDPVTIDLRKMPHGMIAGATGSGKSVCINSILVSLLYKASPTELKMMLIDPKMVELAPFNGIPHLISPVITDVKAATAALKWAVDEMERRYELFAHAGARNIEKYNDMAEANRRFSQKMPYLLIVIDELADLMMVAPNDVEVSISRIAQKARACGIHLIIATQRPSVDVITGIIKANIPTRIAFAVSSQIDSRTIIDSAGAERLLGRGDMLYVGNGQSSSIRLQGTFVTDDEIERIIEHVKSEAAPEYLFGQEDLLASVVEEEESDPLFTEACSFIIEQGSASTSLMQRHFSIGYNRAAKIMDRMEAHGFISEPRGSRSRDVYLTEADLQAFLNPDHEA